MKDELESARQWVGRIKVLAGVIARMSVWSTLGLYKKKTGVGPAGRRDGGAGGGGGGGGDVVHGVT